MPLAIALAGGVVGVLGLIVGSALLVWESRMPLHILQEEADFMVERSAKQ